MIKIIFALIIILFLINTSYEAYGNNKITYDGLYMDNGFNKPPFKLYSRLKDECFEQEAIDKRHCIRVGLSIAYAESSWKDVNTPFGLQSEDKSFEKWVKSYNKYWYKAKDGAFFYGDGGTPPSRYCLSEDSSGTQGWCPNGRRNFNEIFYNLKF